MSLDTLFYSFELIVAKNYLAHLDTHVLIQKCLLLTLVVHLKNLRFLLKELHFLTYDLVLAPK